MRRDYYFPDVSATFTILSDRDIAGPIGIFGGLDGRKASYLLNPDEEPVELSSKCVVDLSPGDTVSFQTPGGGGYGRPEDRDPYLVLGDVINGKITLNRALDLYGVVIDQENQMVDKAKTINRRRVIKNSRGPAI